MLIRELDNLCMGCMSINKTGSVCPDCGFDNEPEQSGLVLPYRTILNKKFLIGRVLGKGGFGITYLAWDLVLQTAVAIKEYLPATLVTREPKRPIVYAHSAEEQSEFEYGLKQFLQEARTLAQFSHANVVRVREFFPANKTAYLVMDYYKGLSLQQFLQQKNRKLTEQEALKIMLPVLNGLAQVHQKGFLHRDIKPDNIYLVNKEHPVLLDFGAARNAINQKSMSLSVILTPGFAPFEQYLSRSNFTPSTDIYSVAATIYYMVSGIKPHEATARLQNDPIIPLVGLEPALGVQFCDSIMKALAVYPENRPQTVEEFEKQLTERPPPSLVNKSVYKPGFIHSPPADTGMPELGLAPIEQPPPSSKAKNYDTFYCPHCQTKNIIREGKGFSEVKCIKCRKSPTEKVKKSLPWVTIIKVSAAILLLMVVYKFITSQVLSDPTIKSIVDPLLVDSNASPRYVPEPQQSPPPERGYNPDPQPIRHAIREDRRARLRDALPPPIEEGQRPYHLPPLFAIEACRGKSVNDGCVANTPRRKLPGVCEEVRGGGVLACIPGNPNE